MIRNHGDGSASPKFCASKQEAEDLESKESEPFAESTVDYVELEVVNGQIHFKYSGVLNKLE